MKKILIASLIALSTQFAIANNEVKADPAFTKIEALIKANNYTEAYKELDKLAKTGNAQAIYNLGYLTQVGQGTTKNEAKAVELYKQASDKGYPVASYVLGKNYVVGSLGLKQDIPTAKKYLEKASSQGFSDATVDLAVLYFAENTDASDKKGIQLLDPLIKKGNYQAIHAQALYDISNGFKLKKEEPIKKGLKSIEDLAQKGYIPALMAIGNMLTNGNIVPQNLPEAKKIFTALAADNVPQAKQSLDVVNKLIAEQAKNPPKAAPAKKS